ncbi:rhodanese-like domain-containing protein, partial [Vibrio vulnificus]
MHPLQFVENTDRFAVSLGVFMRQKNQQQTQ